MVTIVSMTFWWIFIYTLSFVASAAWSYLMIHGCPASSLYSRLFATIVQTSASFARRNQTLHCLKRSQRTLDFGCTLDPSGRRQTHDFIASAVNGPYDKLRLLFFHIRLYECGFL